MLQNFVQWSDTTRANRVVQLLRPFITGRTLDVGCWNGMVARELSDNIVGIDVAQPPNPVIPVTIYNGREIPFQDKEFDTVLCCTALHHAEDQDAVLSEMKRVGRKIVIMEDRYDNIVDRISVVGLHAIGSRVVGMPYLVSGFRPIASWLDLFERHQLTVKSCHACPGIQPLWFGLRHYIFELEPAA